MDIGQLLKVDFATDAAWREYSEGDWPRLLIPRTSTNLKKGWYKRLLQIGSFFENKFKSWLVGVAKWSDSGLKRLFVHAAEVIYTSDRDNPLKTVCPLHRLLHGAF